jgi:hypothetical protein
MKITKKELKQIVIEEMRKIELVEEGSSLSKIGIDNKMIGKIHKLPNKHVWVPKADATYVAVSTKANFNKEMKKNGNLVGIIVNKGEITVVSVDVWGETVVFDLGSPAAPKSGENTYSTISKALATVKGKEYFVTKNTTQPHRVAKNKDADALIESEHKNNKLLKVVYNAIKALYEEYIAEVTDDAIKYLDDGKVGEAWLILHELVGSPRDNYKLPQAVTAHSMFNNQYDDYRSAIAESIIGSRISSYGRTPEIRRILVNATPAEIREHGAKVMRKKKEVLLRTKKSNKRKMEK